MASFTPSSFIAMFSLVFFLLFSGSNSATLIFTISNKCSQTVWPGILSAAGASPPSSTGFTLLPGESKVVVVSRAWFGNVFGRTLCTQDSTGKFSCVTGDCSSSTVECPDGKIAPPVTLAEFALNGNGWLDFYGVSLVYGFNLPMAVEPLGGTGGVDGNCKETGCAVDLNVECPTDLKVIADGEGVACKSGCQAEPCFHSEFFQTACPSARVYSNDHSSFTCASAAGYIITFCPTTTSSINPGSNKPPAAVDDKSDVDCRVSLNNKVTAIVVAVVSIFGVSIAIACYFYIKKRNDGDADGNEDGDGNGDYYLRRFRLYLLAFLLQLHATATERKEMMEMVEMEMEMETSTSVVSA